MIAWFDGVLCFVLLLALSLRKNREKILSVCQPPFEPNMCDESEDMARLWAGAFSKVPEAGTRVLLHSCCAPCSLDILQRMRALGLEVVIFFYNPNIHPKREYETRKNENKRLADHLNIPFVDQDYDVQNWFANTKGLEQEPERGARCSVCFDMRLARAAHYAHAQGFSLLTSSLAASRWKDQKQVFHAGLCAVQGLKPLQYWTYDWRKNKNESQIKVFTQDFPLYRQKYCGCVYSWRK